MYTLHLTEFEALYLKGLLQNPLSSQPENPRGEAARQSIFNALPAFHIAPPPPYNREDDIPF